MPKEELVTKLKATLDQRSAIDALIKQVDAEEAALDALATASGYCPADLMEQAYRR